MRDIIGILPPYRNKRELVKDKQLTSDIVREITEMHNKQKTNYDKIAERFWAGNAERTAKCLFDFLRENVEYKIEPGDVQTVKTPSAILHEGVGDCKHYASFAVGVADALRRKGYPIDAAYMYVNNVDNSNNFHHVFAVIRDTDTGRDYWVDPIDDNTFNRRKNYRRQKTVDMALYKISGDDIGRGRGRLGQQQPSPEMKARVEQLMRERGITANEAVKIVALEIQQAMRPAKKTKAQKRGGRQANREARKANKAARKEEKKMVRAMPKEQRKAYKKAKREDDRNVRQSATGVQKTAHVAMKIPNAVSRNAFLGLLKINAFRMASKMAQKGATDKAWLDQLKKQWFAAGGQWTKLRQAINQGVNVYNVKFTQQVPQISGNGDYGYISPRALMDWERPICNCETYQELEEQAGVYDNSIGDGGGGGGAAAIAALVAAAMPLILKLMGLLRKSGVNTDEIEQGGAEATEEVIDEYNDAQDYPLDEDDPYSGAYGRSRAPQFGIRAYNDPKDGTATIQYTKSNMDDNGDVRYSDSGLDATLDTMKYWVMDNKSTLLWVGGGLAAVVYGPRLLESVMSKKRRRR